MVLTAREIIQDSLTHFKEEQAKAKGRSQKIFRLLFWIFNRSIYRRIFQVRRISRNSSLQY